MIIINKSIIIIIIICAYIQNLRCGPPARSSIPKSVSGSVDGPFTTVVLIIGKRKEERKKKPNQT